MIELRISIENSINEYPDLNFNGLAYSLGFGPQIGPEFEKLDRRNEFRDYSYYVDGKKKKLKIPKEGFLQLENRVNWIAIEGKYFTAIAVPDATQYRITFDTRPINGVEERSSFYFGRPEIKSSKNIDVFRFYIGPKKRDILLTYNDPKKNGFGMQDMHFEEIVSSSIMLGWLANILKFLLEFFYKLIPNYALLCKLYEPLPPYQSFLLTGKYNLQLPFQNHLLLPGCS
ncbi:Membrane protein insertase YidC [subsurface metagenome]